MKFYKLVKYDVVNGIWHKFHNYLVVAVVCLGFFIDFYIKISYSTQNLIGGRQSITITNFLFYFFQGKEPFMPNQENKFIFPVVWILIFLYAAYITLEYPFRNLMEHGMQVIIRVKNKKIWWLSKCFWVFASTLLYFVVLYLVLLILCLICNIDISLGYANYINENILYMQFSSPISTVQVMMLICVLPIMTSLSVNLIQLCLGLFMKRIYSFFITAIILFTSSYFQSVVAIGNFAMVKRSILCNPKGMTMQQGVIVNGGLIILAVMVGFLYINKLDIIKKDT